MKLSGSMKVATESTTEGEQTTFEFADDGGHSMAYDDNDDEDSGGGDLEGGMPQPHFSVGPSDDDEDEESN